MRDNQIKLNLRLDEDLHKRATEAAREAYRSLNNEIQYRLRSSFDSKSDETATA